MLFAAMLQVDPQQVLERTCFQTGRPYADWMNLRSDVAIVYGIDGGMPARVRSWCDRGYRVHLMTGVSWGEYQDYLYGRFDGVNHEDEAQTQRDGTKISHGGDVYYMSPGPSFGRFLCVGVQRALDAGVEAVHLEEPEFWVRGGYSEGFKREWQSYYGEAWQPPHSSVDAQWRASKLKYFLYRRALQTVFSYVQDWNKANGRHVRCYVPTHSLINYAHWQIVSPESSLARLKGCDGYIAQVWTGTSRTPNNYRGAFQERTFETAFLEYGAMQNLVRSTGRSVWYLNDPVEDDPNHDWGDYRRNWRSTLVASLLQPEVSQYEITPWPERVFGDKYPSETARKTRVPIPPDYATELQTVFNALKEMKQEKMAWDCGSQGIGVVVSDSLMFERGEPNGSDGPMGHFYGLAMPLVKRGVPVEPVQLESATIKGYLERYRVLLMTYRGMKPLSPNVHDALAKWVRSGGVLVFVDDDGDPYNKVRDWWNTDGLAYSTPRLHLFEKLGLNDSGKVGKGFVILDRRDPAELSKQKEGDLAVAKLVEGALSSLKQRARWTNYLLLQRGPYTLAAGLDESIGGPSKVLQGGYVNLFDPNLAFVERVELSPGTRAFLVEPAKMRGPVVAASCQILPVPDPVWGEQRQRFSVEGIAGTNAVVLLRLAHRPREVSLGGQSVDYTFDEAHHLLWVQFGNEARPRELVLLK